MRHQLQWSLLFPAGQPTHWRREPVHAHNLPVQHGGHVHRDGIHARALHRHHTYVQTPCQRQVLVTIFIGAYAELLNMFFKS